MSHNIGNGANLTRLNRMTYCNGTYPSYPGSAEEGGPGRVQQDPRGMAPFRYLLVKTPKALKKLFISPKTLSLTAPAWSSTQPSSHRTHFRYQEVVPDLTPLSSPFLPIPCSGSACFQATTSSAELFRWPRQRGLVCGPQQMHSP